MEFFSAPDPKDMKGDVRVNRVKTLSSALYGEPFWLPYLSRSEVESAHFWGDLLFRWAGVT